MTGQLKIQSDGSHIEVDRLVQRAACSSPNLEVGGLSPADSLIQLLFFLSKIHNIPFANKNAKSI